MAQATAADLVKLTQVANLQYNSGRYREALAVCEKVYALDAARSDNLLLLGALHFQLRNFSEAIFYSQQAVRVDPTFAEAYSNLGNPLKVCLLMSSLCTSLRLLCLYTLAWAWGTAITGAGRFIRRNAILFEGDQTQAALYRRIQQSSPMLYAGMSELFESESAWRKERNKILIQLSTLSTYNWLAS